MSLQYVKVLRQRRVAVLWLSQLLSETGNQIYLVAALWIAAQISPASTALVAAAEFGSGFLCTLIAGVYADRLHKIQAMISTDIIRAIVVMTLPVMAYFGSITIPHLLLVGMVLGSLTTLFDPCLVATIPVIADDSDSLHTINALMDATKRLARTVGPGVAGLLAACIPISQFFTIDAFSYVASALGVAYLGYKYPERFSQADKSPMHSESILQELQEALAIAKTNQIIARDLAVFVIANVAYAITYTVGLPIISKQKFGGTIGAYGLIIAAYGVGSLIGNLILGNMKAGKPKQIIFIGYLIWGLGFLTIGLAPNLSIGMLGAALGAIGSPLVNVTIATNIQAKMPASQIGKVFALRLQVAYAGIGIGLALAAYLFEHFPASILIALFSSLFFLVGFIMRFRLPWDSTDPAN